MYLTYVGSQNDVVPLRTEKLAAHKDLVGRYFRGLINKPTGSQTFRKLCGLKWESNIWRHALTILMKSKQLELELVWEMFSMADGC